KANAPLESKPSTGLVRAVGQRCRRLTRLHRDLSHGVGGSGRSVDRTFLLLRGEQVVQLLALKRFELEEGVRDAVEEGAMVAEDSGRASLRLVDDAADFGIDELGGLLAVVARSENSRL